MGFTDLLIGVLGLMLILVGGGLYVAVQNNVFTEVGYMEALKPGLKSLGYEVIETRRFNEAKALVLQDSSAKYILLCRKDPTRSLLSGNDTKVYNGSVVQSSTFGRRGGDITYNTFYEAGYLCMFGSRSGRATTGIQELRTVISNRTTLT